MKPLAFYCIADANNLPHYEKMLKSFSHFHPDIPMILIGDEQIKNHNDQMFFYRATPLVAKELLQEYECVVKIDADTIVTGDLSHIWEGEFDVAVVQNSNPRELSALRVTVWDIDPLAYVNCGLVVIKSPKFVDHWLKLCYGPQFNSYQMREQDLFNIMVFYGYYNVKFLDLSERWHGLISKGYWPQIRVQEVPSQNGLQLSLVLPKNNEWPVDNSKKIVAIHFAGGQDPTKGNYKNKFQPEVVRYLDELTK